MTLEELRDIILDRINLSEQHTAEQFRQVDARIDQNERHTTERIDQSEKHTTEQFREVNARFDRSDARADRQDEKIDTLLEAVTERREVAAESRGERIFTRRFWKHIAWIAPTVLALIALLKSFFG